MIHKYAIGQEVYYKAPIKHMGARGTYKIVGTRPIESDNRVSYRIKSAAETFERTADERDLTLARSVASCQRFKACVASVA